MRSSFRGLRIPLPHRRRGWRALSWLLPGLVVVAMHAVVVPRRSSAQEATAAAPPDMLRLQSIVNDLKARLSIPQPVETVLVPTNPLMMSVEAPRDASEAFLLSIEVAFLDVLSDNELEAAIAHELGHVWVFTHHPFLQTEQLANEIAMRAVSRASLEQVYEKVWKRGDTKGDLVRFLGPRPAAGLAPPDQPK
jgi:hypothetical protein